MEGKDVGKGGTCKINTSARIPHCCRCRNHGIVSLLKGHKKFCPWRSCTCKSCILTSQRQQTSREQIAIKRQWKMEEELGILPPVDVNTVSGSLQMLMQRYPTYNIQKLNTILKCCNDNAQQAIQRIDSTVNKALEQISEENSSGGYNSYSGLANPCNGEFRPSFSNYPSPGNSYQNTRTVTPLPIASFGYPPPTNNYSPSAQSCMSPYSGNYPWGGAHQGFVPVTQLSYPCMRPFECYNGIESIPDFGVLSQNQTQPEYCQSNSDFETGSDYQDASPISVTSNEGQLIIDLDDEQKNNVHDGNI